MNKLDEEIKIGRGFEDVKTEHMIDAGFQEEYNSLNPRYPIMAQIISARRSQ